MHHCKLREGRDTASYVAKLLRSEAGIAAADSGLTRLLRGLLLWHSLLVPCTLLLLLPPLL
jgi:hypothetical protein